MKARLAQAAIHECALSALRNGDIAGQLQTLEIRLRMAGSWKPEYADQFRSEVKRIEGEAMAMLLLMAA